MTLLHTTCLAVLLTLSGCFGSVESSDLPEPEVHRGESIMCDDVRDSPAISSSPGGGCSTHEECTGGDNGRCLSGRGENYCSYDACFADADCDGPCVCGTGAGGNSCTSGGCQVDADCGPGGWCSPTYGSCGLYGGVVAYECHTPDDECTDDADCSDMPNAYCKFAPEAGHWVCDNGQCEG